MWTLLAFMSLYSVITSIHKESAPEPQSAWEVLGDDLGFVFKENAFDTDVNVHSTIDERDTQPILSPPSTLTEGNTNKESLPPTESTRPLEHKSTNENLSTTANPPEKTPAYNTKSEKVIPEVSVQGVNQSDVLIELDCERVEHESCNEEPNTEPTPFPSPIEPEPPVDPIVVELPLPTPTPAPGDDPDDKVVVAPPPQIPCDPAMPRIPLEQQSFLVCPH